MTTRIFVTSYGNSSGGYGASLVDRQNCYVAAGVTVGSEAVYGINSNYGYNRVDIYGNVVGGDVGVYLGNSSSASHDHTLFLHSGGQIYGFGSHGVVLEGYNELVTNQGYIFGSQDGVFLYSSGSSASSSLINSGTIEAGSEGVYHSYDVNAVGATLILTNSGTITGGSHSYYAVDGDSLVDLITNTGKMIGNVYLGDGNDSIDTHLGTVQGTIDLGAGNDTAFGSATADTIYGGTEDDLIRGGGGKDVLDGGDGVDTADYSDKTVKVQVTLNGANAVSVLVNGVAEDSIKNFERVTGGSAGDTLTGDGLANLLTGNAGNDTMSGGNGNDTLAGGFGNDVLTGGANADIFRFNTALGSTNIDTITDFSHADDTIQLDNAVMAALGATTGALSSAMFHANTSGHAATTTSQHVIYDKSNGTLWYDSDGSGTAHAAVQIATLSGHPSNVDYTDFRII